MIKRSGFNSLFNKLFPLQSDFELLTNTQRRRLQITWVGLAIFLAALLFLVLLVLTSRTPDIVIPETATLVTTPAAQNAAPNQPVELKTAALSTINPDVDVIAGNIQSDSNYINITFQVAGNIIHDPSLPQLTVYQVGFDTDLDATTGFLMNSIGIGAEYLADFDSKGNVVLLHWVQNESRFESVPGAEVKQLNNNTLAFSVARASLGYPSQVNMVLLSNDGGSKNQSFLPTSSFVHYQLAQANQSTQPNPQSLWPYTVSTSQNNATNTIEIRQAADKTLNPDFDITYGKVIVDSSTLTATLQVAGKIENSAAAKPGAAFYQLLLDTDGNPKNNFGIDRLGLGAEYLADQDSNGFSSILQWDSDNLSFSGVGGLHTHINGNTLTYVMPLSSIGNPTSISFAFTASDTRSSQQNYLPDRSHATISTVINASTLTNTTKAASSDQSLQLTNTNLQIGDGYLNATLQTASPLDATNSSNSSYQLLIGKILTQTTTLTDTTALPANVIEPGLQVFYKLVFTPSQTSSQVQLYSWLEQSQSFKAVQILTATVQSNKIAFNVPLSAIGSGLVGYYFQTYNPQDGFNQLLPQNKPAQLLIPGSKHQMLLASTDITASNSLVTQVTLDSMATGVDFSVQSRPNQAKTTDLTFWIDSDRDSSTGQQGLHSALGVDYMLKYSPTLDPAHVQIFSYDQTQKTMKLLEIVPAQFDAATNSLKFELPYSPDTLNLAASFNMAVYASSATTNQTQLIPASSQDYARIDFQRQETSQNLTAQPQSKPNLSLKQFAFNFDGFYLTGDFSLAKLLASTDTTTYSVNLAAYAPDANASDPQPTTKLVPTYFTISYNPQLNRATLQRWSDSDQRYQIVTQLDSTLNQQNNSVEFKLPYSLLGQPYFVNYIVSVQNGNNVQNLPAFNAASSNSSSDFFTVQQPTATFYFKNSLQNSSFDMKQNAGQ